MAKIISGGQSGVDRAALDAAIEAGLPYGGWCPNGGWAEDLAEPPGLLPLYPNLQETPDAAPEKRTLWNVLDCDALMVLTDRTGLGVSPGTQLALAWAEGSKPHIVLDIEAPDARAAARAFLALRAGDIVCIAGPRESEAPGIYAKAKAFLATLFAD